MGRNVTLGGERLGSGNKQKVFLHGYERSSHDLGYLWRSTMAAGTLVPFLSEVALPGDTFDIHLDVDIKTHPTIGPLFGSYKVQLDVFQAPVRLYQGQLHNNKLGIGMNMAQVKLPFVELAAVQIAEGTTDQDNAQINPSCIWSYLGIRGVCALQGGETDPVPRRKFNGIPFLAYWDIYKQYYANKQEEIGAVIHTDVIAVNQDVTSVHITDSQTDDTISQAPTISVRPIFEAGTQIIINYTGGPVEAYMIVINLLDGRQIPANEIGTQVSNTGGVLTIEYNYTKYGNVTVTNWDYAPASNLPVLPPNVVTFPLENIDTMRENILAAATAGATPFDIRDQNLTPYSYPMDVEGTGETLRTTMVNTQEGLAVKTYQSDLFNNWLSTEWIDGAGGITEVTAIDTSGGSFTLDTLNLSKKVYDMLNRIAVSGGTYDDWLDAVYDHDRIQRAESPIYHGGLIRELVFQEVVSNSQSDGQDGTQPLGTLAGKGVMSGKRKGGNMVIRIDEPSYIMGIISLTPRIDYSQGNKWDTHLETMDDFHKPALDEIGFQELIQEQMGWWTTVKGAGTQVYTTKSAGKQPAWINYMTNVNQTRGNFAIADNEMFMTLNRRYEHVDADIADMTTYIDPQKFNFIFAQTSLDAQNFWAQIAVDITARRKMSAKIMPNL